MKKKILIITISIFVWLAGCTNRVPLTKENSITLAGSGQIATKEFNLSGFDGVETGLIFDVSLSQADEYKVVVYADDNFIDFIEMEVQGTTLMMGYKPGYTYDLNNVSLRAEVTMPEIKSLQLTSSSQVTLDNFRDQEDLEVTLTGASSLHGRLEAVAMTINASSSTYVNLTGTVANISIFADGNSLVDLKGLEAGHASLDTSGVSRVLVNVTGDLDVLANQNSQIYYYGDPVLGEVIVNQFSKVEAKGTK